MQKGIITNMFNSALAETGNDPRLAGATVARKLESFLNSSDPSKRIKPEDFKIAQLAHELIPSLYNGSVDLNSAEDVQNAVRSSQFPTISRVVINAAIMDSYNTYLEGADKLVSELDATRTTDETLAGFTETESLEIRPEGMSYEETNFGEKDVSIKMADFGRTISITREALFNDRTGQLLKRAREFGEKGGLHRSKMIIQTLECLPRTAFKEATGASRAFVYKGSAIQAAAFYASTHVTLDGRVNNNVNTSNPLTGWQNIETSDLLFQNMVDSQGDEIAVSPKYILVPPAKKVTLWQILNSSSLIPVVSTPATAAGTAVITPGMTTNPAAGNGPLGGLTPIVSRFLSSSNVWYHGDFPRQLNWLWVYKPATQALAASTDKAFYQNITVTYKFSYHGGCGHSDYCYIVKNS